MEKKEFKISYQLFSERSQLPQDEQNLLDRAFRSCNFAYAPFSRFRVGVAVLLDGGDIVLGNNQENKAFPSGLCAERVALFSIGASGKATKIRKMAIRAISAVNKVDAPAMPCGACRQVMLEYEQMTDHDMVVLMQGEEGDILRVEGVAKSLLPFHFDTKFT
ncbi:MAG: cytidine deaminase [Bacteroidia bacterium]|nr:cytidine deaminase [Bacteroidia bacterium]